MGYVFATGHCLSCKQLFTFNPDFVPSLKGEPVCKECMEAANRKRKEMGLPPHPIHPEAYEPQKCI